MLRTRLQWSTAYFVAAVLIPLSGLEAQILTPTYMGPRSGSDVGVYLSDGPGEFAVEGIWRRGFGSYDLGIRAGVADTDDLSVLIGGEYRNPIAVGAPLDFAVTAAAQAALGDATAAGFTAGLAIGHTFGAADFSIAPYLHPRIGLIDGFAADEFDLELLADVGADVRFTPRLDMRFGVVIDGIGADWGVGFAWR